MCGLTAVISHSSSNPSPVELASAMSAAIPHRGPDAHDVWSEDSVALGHVRLSILELSPAGAQPMVSSDGRWVIAFNGEIYDHAAMRSDLSGPWRGRSDTETLVEAFAAWGPEVALTRASGMFAIAAWDRRERRLWLARDRFGEKPLYYGIVGSTFRAASELKALLAGAPRPAVDRNALALFLRHNYVPGPYTIWQGVHKLPPGHLLSVDAAGHADAPRPWWRVADLVTTPAFTGSDDDAVNELDRRLRLVVGRQMAADVPLGAFLSGGVDSSAVVALMQAQSTRRVRTFTIGFEEKDYDESGHAEAVARHLHTEHTTMRVTAEEARSVIPDLPTIWDEPFADSSQIPTLLLSRLTKQHVTVSLSGDGGDELFAGYNRYTLLSKLARAYAIPTILRRVIAIAMRAVPPRIWDMAAWPLPGARRAGDKAHKLASVLAAQGVDELYLGLVSHWPDPSRIVLGGTEPATALTDGWARTIADRLRRLQYLDQVTYLPDDILVKVDRAAMSTSLETRVPLLDHGLAAFAWSLPNRMRVRDGHGKWILRQVLDRYVPRALIERPKMGFGIPLGEWLRGPLRAWAEDLLAEDRLRREGFFHPAPIRLKWAEHLTGRRNWQYHLWDILMFQAWHARWLGS